MRPPILLSIFASVEHVLKLGACVMLLLLSACGFHLRGAYQLPASVSAISLQSPDRLSPLHLELERQLLSNRIALAKDGQVDVARVELVSERLQREILSVNDRARVSEYLLRYSVQVRILLPDQSSEEIAAKNLELSREYSFDETQALGAAQEEAIISAELYRDMAALILRRVGR